MVRGLLKGTADVGRSSVSEKRGGAMSGLHVAGLLLLGTGLAMASAWDVMERRVPNRLNVALLIAGLTFSVVDAGLAGLAQGVVGLACGLGLLVLPFARGWVGAGDVKLLGAVGAWLGPEGTLYCALAGAVLGGVLALVYLLKADANHRRVVFTNLRLSLYVRSVPELEPRPARLSPPYAVALSAGAVIAVIVKGGLGVCG